MKSAIIVIVGIIGIILLAFAVWWTQSHSVYAVEEPITASPNDCPSDLRLGIIGDYGVNKAAEADVASLVDSWDVDAIVTTGDNNYPRGGANTIDQNIGQFYQAFIHPYVGEFGLGAEINRFYPALGNHDLMSKDGQAYFDYFTLPGNERTYDVQLDPVHLFILNSDPSELSGRTADSDQAQWLREGLAASNAPWKLVVMHHTPYTSSLKRNPDKQLQWPYAAWGATAVLSGHDHLYERLMADGIPYFVNGAGGQNLYSIGIPEPQSIMRYNQDHGAMRVQANTQCINFSFFNRDNALIDSYTVTK